MSTRWNVSRRARARSVAPAARGTTGGPAPLVATSTTYHRPQIRHIEVDHDWRRCGSTEGGCGVLLPLGQFVCPRCGQTNREDLLPLNIRRLLPTHDAYEHAVAVLRGTLPAPASPAASSGRGAPLAITGHSSEALTESVASGSEG